MDIQQYMSSLGADARDASRHMARASSAQKNSALAAIADALKASRADILAANGQDMQRGRDNGLDAALPQGDRSRLIEAWAQRLHDYGEDELDAATRECIASASWPACEAAALPVWQQLLQPDAEKGSQVAVLHAVKIRRIGHNKIHAAIRHIKLGR